MSEIIGDPGPDPRISGTGIRLGRHRHDRAGRVAEEAAPGRVEGVDDSLVPETAEGFAQRKGMGHGAARLGRGREDRDAQAVDLGTARRGPRPVRDSRPKPETTLSAALSEIREVAVASIVPVCAPAMRPA